MWVTTFCKLVLKKKWGGFTGKCNDNVCFKMPFNSNYWERWGGRELINSQLGRKYERGGKLGFWERILSHKEGNEWKRTEREKTQHIQLWRVSQDWSHWFSAWAMQLGTLQKASFPNHVYSTTCTHLGTVHNFQCVWNWQDSIHPFQNLSLVRLKILTRIWYSL